MILTFFLCISVVVSSLLAAGSPEYKCSFVNGDGQGGTEKKIGDQTGNDCVNACLEFKKIDQSINGVTVYSDNKVGCWCESKMNKVTSSTEYKTCFLQSQESPAYKCSFVNGDGQGGSEKDIGVLSGNDCINACIELKKKDQSINGVTLYSDNKVGCWCESKMNKVTKSTEYKTCFLQSQDQTSGTEDASPEFDLDYGGNDIKNYPNTESWQQCALYCHAWNGCRAWTWVNPAFARKWQRNYCYLKNDNFRNGYRKLVDVVSGVTALGDVCPQTGVNYEGHTIKSLVNVETWQDCSNQCRNYAACHAWTWFNEENVVEKRAYHCYLKNSNFPSGRKEFARSVSGGRRCGATAASTIDGGGWLLVRHVPAGVKWYKATDRLTGDNVYGTPCGETCKDEWSIRFRGTNFNQFLFATGDEQKWLIVDKQEVTGEWYWNKERMIYKSSLKPDGPYKARWYRRPRNREDPWISLNDHGRAIKEGNILYGENGYGNVHARAVLPMHNGANVYIRMHDYTRVCEHRTLRMDCAPGHVCHVKSAIYGRQRNKVCWSGRNTNCGDPKNSLKVLQEKCEGRLNCVVNAKNNVFGDPCRGTYKYLEVDYECLSAEVAKARGVKIDPCALCHADAVCHRSGATATCICKCGFIGSGKGKEDGCKKATYKDLLAEDGKEIKLSEQCAIKRHSLLLTIPRLSTGYRVKFEVFPTAFQWGWTNVVHLTKSGQDHQVYGARTPAVFFHSANPNEKSNRFHICSAVDNNRNYCINTNKIVEKGKWTTVEVSQLREPGQIFYTYRVLVNGAVVGTQVNEAASAFSEVKVFTSDNFYNAAPGFLRNISIVPDADALNSDAVVHDISNITKSMAGSWEISYSNGHQAKFEIQPNGAMTVSWESGRRTQETKIVASINEQNFPFSDGWVMGLSIYRPGTWEYYRLREYSGITYIQVEHFCQRHCRGRRENLDKYCCYGAGTRDIMQEPGNTEKPAAIPNSVHWHDQGEVCFGAKNDAFGKFTLTHSGLFKGIELIHLRGWVSCQVVNPEENKLPTNWGCNHDMRRSLGTVVTSSTDSVIFPHSQDYGMYAVKGFDAFSKKLAFSNWLNPMRAVKGQEFRIWFSEDIVKQGEKDNMGQSCVFVRAYID